jgi:hypothetical protein
MLYKEIIAVCFEIHTKHINTLCGQNVELLNVKLAVHIVTSGLRGLLIVQCACGLPALDTFFWYINSTFRAAGNKKFPAY